MNVARPVYSTLMISLLIIIGGILPVATAGGGRYIGADTNTYWADFHYDSFYTDTSCDSGCMMSYIDAARSYIDGKNSALHNHYPYYTWMLIDWPKDAVLESSLHYYAKVFSFIGRTGFEPARQHCFLWWCWWDTGYNYLVSHDNKHVSYYDIVNYDLSHQRPDQTRLILFIGAGKFSGFVGGIRADGSWTDTPPDDKYFEIAEAVLSRGGIAFVGIMYRDPVAMPGMPRNPSSNAPDIRPEGVAAWLMMFYYYAGVQKKTVYAAALLASEQTSPSLMPPWSGDIVFRGNYNIRIVQ